MVESDVQALVEALVESDVQALVDAEVEALVEALDESDDAGLCLTLAVASFSSALRLLPPNMSIIVSFGARERLNNAVANSSWFMLLRPAKLSCAAKLYSSPFL